MIIAITGQKGGSGKSTMAISLACEWRARGKRVLLVDADPQGSCRAWGEVAAQQSKAAPTVISMGAGMHRPDQLPALADAYDVTLIDCPPRLDEVQRAALLVADLAIFPCSPSAMESWALPATIDYFEKARMIRPNLSGAILITRKVPRTSIAEQARELLQHASVPIFRSEICHRIVYQQAPASGSGVTDYAPTSAAAAEVRSLAGEIESLAGKRSQSIAA